MSQPRIVWQPNPGSQVRFLTCPILEVMLGGPRGTGKTDVLLMDFAREVGLGWGAEWRGILFRRTYPELEDVVSKSLKWFTQIFPGATFNKAALIWTFETGETLKFRHAKSLQDYYSYHGHAFTWMGFEELTNWPDSALYFQLMTLVRSSCPGVPKRIRSTANPWGTGHGWVKARFVDPAPPETRIIENGRERAYVHSKLSENRHLTENDPDYIKTLEALEDDAKRKAWLEGDWNIAAGGIFTDVWDASVHVVEPCVIPHGWQVSRSFDWGSSKPWGCMWWAESDGTQYVDSSGQLACVPRGTVFGIAELYGWTGKPNEGTRQLAGDVADQIAEVDRSMKRQVVPGPADSAIFTTENGRSIADDMARRQVRWTQANKSAGSRVSGWETIRGMLAAANRSPQEDPGLFIFSTCRHWLRTVPTLARDDRNPDDVDTNAEDHMGDLTRYRLLRAPKQVGFASFGA